MPRRLSCLLLGCVPLAVGVVFVAGRGPWRTRPTPTNAALHDAYSAMRRRVQPEEWPDALAAKKLWRGLVRTGANGRSAAPSPRRFAQDGPLQVTAFFDAHHPAVAIAHEARRKIFDPLVAELRSGERPLSCSLYRALCSLCVSCYRALTYPVCSLRSARRLSRGLGPRRVASFG